jgi:hypothetical protein
LRPPSSLDTCPSWLSFLLEWTLSIRDTTVLRRTSDLLLLASIMAGEYPTTNHCQCQSQNYSMTIGLTPIMLYVRYVTPHKRPSISIRKLIAPTVPFITPWLRTAWKTPLIVVLPSLPWEYFCLQSRYSATAVVYLLLPRLFPSKGCGGVFEYLHRSPASRWRRRKGNPEPGGITGLSGSWGM